MTNGLVQRTTLVESISIQWVILRQKSEHTHLFGHRCLNIKAVKHFKGYNTELDHAETLSFSLFLVKHEIR